MGSRDWLGAADPEFCRASGNDAVTCGVDDREFAGSENKRGELEATCIEMYVLKAHESAHRCTVNAGMGDVKLHNFVT